MSHPGTAVQRRLQDHWRWRPDWSADRPDLWWYLTFEDEPGVSSATERLVSGLLGSAAVSVVPSWCLHLTLRELGFVDEVGQIGVEAAMAAARRSLASFPVFELELASVSSMPGAVVLEATPVDVVEALRRRLPARTGTDQIESAAATEEIVAPHVSLAYTNRDCEADEVMRRLPDAVDPVRARVSRVTLAAVTRLDQHYQWSVEGIVGLAPAGSPGDEAA